MKVPLISILLMTAVIVGWQLISSDQSTLPKTTAVADTEADTESTPIKRTTVVSELQNSTRTALELAEPDYDLIHGFRFRKDRDCYLEVDEIMDPVTGDLRKIFSCTPITPRETDPYLTYETEVLAGMAYGDPRAAEVLGLRLLNSADPETETIGLRYLLHAVALTNDTRGIALAVNHRYNRFFSNGELDIQGVKRLVTLSHIANTVSPGSMSADAYQQLLRDNGVGEDEIAGLIARGNAWLQSMADAQTETTGNTQIREALNDA